MKKLVKVQCVLMALLAVLVTMQCSCVSATVMPSEAPAVPEETVQEQTVPVTVETEPLLTNTKEETAPAATVPAQTLPAETVPEQTASSEEADPPVETIPSLESLTFLLETEEDYDTVPLYFQTDYPNTMYGSGSLANNGCGVASLAMVATYLTEHEYLPDELARYFGGVAENNIERLEKGADAMQLPWKKMKNFNAAMDALREGKVVIALMGPMSLFTETQHFIVLTGFNDDGLIMVNDPYEPNYEKWNLKRAFQEGFTEGDICSGFSGAWAFDKSAMPEEPFLYFENEQLGEPRYPDIRLTYEEIQLLARMVWVEARGESEEGQQAVAEVVLNRLASGRFPNTLKDVIYADNQFRSVDYLEDAEPAQAQYEAIEHAIYGPYVLPEDVVHFATYATNKNVWGQIGGHIFCYEF